MIDLSKYPLPAIVAVSLVIILLAGEIGRRLGLYAGARGGHNDSTLESAILGLLSLMISFTFAMALTLYEARRDAVLNEANAIGATAFRARLLPSPQDAEILELLRNYLRLRLDITQKILPAQEFAAEVARSNTIHESLWKQAREAAAKNSEFVPTGLFIQALNVMIDDQEKRLAALRNRIPNIVLLALYGIAAVAIGVGGYGAGVEPRRSRLQVFVIGILVSFVIFLIQDLDRPGTGFIRVSQQPMVDVAASIGAIAD